MIRRWPARRGWYTNGDQIASTCGLRATSARYAPPPGRAPAARAGGGGARALAEAAQHRRVRRERVAAGDVEQVLAVHVRRRRVAVEVGDDDRARLHRRADGRVVGPPAPVQEGRG